jgi:hypothetical protein
VTITATLIPFTGAMTITGDGDTQYFQVAGYVGDRFLDRARVIRAADDVIRDTGLVRPDGWVGGGRTITATLEPHPTRCSTCVDGCACEVGSDGCGHRGCWGNPDPAVKDSCPGMAAMAPTAWLRYGAVMPSLRLAV